MQVWTIKSWTVFGEGESFHDTAVHTIVNEDSLDPADRCYIVAIKEISILEYWGSCLPDVMELNCLFTDQDGQPC